MIPSARCPSGCPVAKTKWHIDCDIGFCKTFFMNTLISFFMSGITIATLQVSSPAFDANGYIPAKYSCEGQSVNPPISIKGIPAGTNSLALIVDDPDAPKGNFDHWIIWNIDPGATISENTAPGIEGKNGRGENKYTGPCPPTGVHHYHFKVYALDRKLDLKADASKAELETAMKGHELARGELVGLYQKSRQ
jgi:Raf kinase inhibitor-like YbhB/YbcL family protein